MARRKIHFGIIGGGMMGREFAAAAARWGSLLGLDFEPVIVAINDPKQATRDWFCENYPSIQIATDDYRAVLADRRVEAVYIAVQHHLHERLYIDAIEAGKHLLAEKPFGIDLPANRAILAACQAHPDVFVRCSSEFPFFPGAYRIGQWLREGRFGQIIEVEAGFWHSSDLDPRKLINWKRILATCGAYGCMGDLGMHVLHLPLRAGWFPTNVRALLSKVIEERPDPEGLMVPCETWDNAILACEVRTAEQHFPMTISTKRIAPGHANTWLLRVAGTACSAEFSTRTPKQLAFLPYTPGGAQEWHVLDMPYQSAYATITGPIFEFGFGDAMLQMTAAFCDELVHGREGMRQALYCATPQEAAFSHRVFTAALESQRGAKVVTLEDGPQ